MDALTECATCENDEHVIIDPLELDDFGTTIDDEYLSKWNSFVESSDLDDWDEDDQADADAIAATAMFTEDGWQRHFMRRMITDAYGEKIDWQNPEITKFKAEVEGKPAISEMLDRELAWRENLE
jgi:hypothetical protein